MIKVPNLPGYKTDMGQTFFDMEPAEINSLSRVIRMSKKRQYGICMETRLSQIMSIFDVSRSNLSLDLFPLLTSDFGITLMILNVHVIGHVTF